MVGSDPGATSWAAAPDSWPTSNRCLWRSACARLVGR